LFPFDQFSLKTGLLLSLNIIIDGMIIKATVLKILRAKALDLPGTFRLLILIAGIIDAGLKQPAYKSINHSHRRSKIR